MQAMDQGAIEWMRAVDHDQGAIEWMRAMGGTSDVSGSNSWSDGRCKRWIREYLKELWVVQAMDQGAIEGAMDDASNGSGSNRLNDEWCK